VRHAGLWHPRLLQIITAMGHGDTVVIADAGLPAPDHVEVIDLVWHRQQPRLLPVLDAVVGELAVESATVAEEAKDRDLLDGLGRVLGQIPQTLVGHEALKDLCRDARAVVRTGEDTPYANVILHAGVVF
jgi:D-ribose pyranase